MPDPVSYTHLDVYKRQKLRRAQKLVGRRKKGSNRRGRALLNVQRAVSYTHLDVYKRQGFRGRCDIQGGIRRKVCRFHGEST